MSPCPLDSSLTPRNLMVAVSVGQRHARGQCRSSGAIRINNATPMSPSIVLVITQPTHRSSYADDGHHSSGLSQFGAVREEAFRVARGAAFDDRDVFYTHPRIFKLSLVRRDQVKMDFRPEVAAPRRTLVQKQQRILDVNGVCVEYLFEQLARICELRLELGPHLGAHRIAALADTWPDRRPQIARLASELAAHLARALLHDARCRPAPAGVKCSYHSPLHIGHQNGHTVRSPNRKQDARNIRN